MPRKHVGASAGPTAKLKAGEWRALKGFERFDPLYSTFDHRPDIIKMRMRGVNEDGVRFSQSR